MLQAAFSNHLISLSFYRSFVKFSQLPVVALSVTTKSLVKSNTARVVDIFKASSLYFHKSQGCF